MNNDISHAISSPWASLALSQQVGISHAHWLVDFRWVCQWEKMGERLADEGKKNTVFPLHPLPQEGGISRGIKD